MRPSRPLRPSHRLLLPACALWLAACGAPAPEAPEAIGGPAPTPPAEFDPLAVARASAGRIVNREAVVPPQCYTKTDGVANPCWTCHTPAHGHNRMDDAGLQERYAFSEFARENRWSNLFVDRRAAIAAISDAEILAWVRQDNYTPLRAALATRRDLLGWRPDLDLARGFDAEGFARDGSGWRAFRYVPFPGTFWPTNGSADDIFIRLPPPFRTDAGGAPSLEVYRLNLAILEAALAVPDDVPDAALRRAVEPVDEALAGADLDGNGRVGGRVSILRRLPAHYAGGAAAVPVVRHLYPQGTEFLHSLRYLDPAAPDMIATRMKELRHATKALWTAPAALAPIYTEERAHKSAGVPPHYVGSPLTGLLNDFGWQLQAYIEDAQGRLRLQTHEEHLYCMGCHSTLGVTVDQTFGFPRKPPGAAGWGYASLAGLVDRPQAGSSEPEVRRYFARVGGGDEFRANAEILERFFDGGRLEPRALAAADLRALLLPSPARALALNKAYLALVREQRFERGRDTLLAPAVNVHRRIDTEDTGLAARGAVHRDGRLWLDWGEP